MLKILICSQFCHCSRYYSDHPYNVQIPGVFINFIYRPIFQSIKAVYPHVSQKLTYRSFWSSRVSWLATVHFPCSCVPTLISLIKYLLYNTASWSPTEMLLCSVVVTMHLELCDTPHWWEVAKMGRWPQVGNIQFLLSLLLAVKGWLPPAGGVFA